MADFRQIDELNSVVEDAARAESRLLLVRPQAMRDECTKGSRW